MTNKESISPKITDEKLRSEIHDDGNDGYIADHTKILAFYSPKYYQKNKDPLAWKHENSAWSDVANAKSNFDGHHQPRIPRELGFYDLEHIEVMRKQVALARAYGVHGFCFYYHWSHDGCSDGEVLENFLHSDIDQPFCLCWVDERSTELRDRLSDNILTRKQSSTADEEQFVQAIHPFLLDPRYIRVDGKPMLLISRTQVLGNPANSIKKLRIHAQGLGLSGLHIVVFDGHDIHHPKDIGANAIVEFPPYTLKESEHVAAPLPQMINENYHGRLFEYVAVLMQGILRSTPSFSLYRGIIPGWDDTARSQDSAVTFVGTTPELFNIWLRFLRSWTRTTMAGREDTFIFINAWNDWLSGCHLEPDTRWGMTYLNEIKRSAYVSLQDQVTVAEARALALQRIEQVAEHTRSIDILQLQHDALTSRAASLQKTVTEIRKKNIESAKEMLIDGIKSYLYEYPRLYRIAHKTNRILIRIKRMLKRQF